MKQKSHSGAKKRIKRTGTGKITMAKPNKRHLLLQKSKKQKRAGLKNISLMGKMAAKMKNLLPHK